MKKSAFREYLEKLCRETYTPRKELDPEQLTLFAKRYEKRKREEVKLLDDFDEDEDEDEEEEDE